MAAAKAFSVVRQASGWTLIAPNRSRRAFPFKVDAEEAALRLAKAAAARGEVVAVLVQGDFGEMTSIKIGPAGRR